MQSTMSVRFEGGAENDIDVWEISLCMLTCQTRFGLLVVGCSGSHKQALR